MFGFARFASLSILVVSVCNGAPTPKGDSLNKRDGIPATFVSTAIVSALQNRQAPSKTPKGPEPVKVNSSKVEPLKVEPPKIEPPKVEGAKMPKPPAGPPPMPKEKRDGTVVSTTIAFPLQKRQAPPKMPKAPELGKMPKLPGDMPPMPKA